MKRTVLATVLIPILGITILTLTNSCSCKPKHPRPGDVLFIDSFNNPVTLNENWEIFDQENPLTGPSVWEIKKGRLWQTSNIYRGGNDEYKYYEGSNILVRGDFNWPNYEFSVDFGISGNGDGVGILFRYQDEDHYYRLLMVSDSSNGGPFMKLQSKEGSRYRILAENKKAYDPYHHHRVKIIAAGKNITVIYDDQKLFNVRMTGTKQAVLG